MFKKIIPLFLLMIFVLTAGFGCKTTNKSTQAALQPITLTYWRVYDDSDSFQEIIDKYKTLHPNITIQYRKLRYDEYETELLNAMAEDRGPDILSLHNTWLRKYQNKLAAMPTSTTMAYQVETGTIKKEIVSELKTSKSLTSKDLKDKFVDAVYNDVVLDDGKIYGLPLSVDTLALFYNRDLLNNAGLTEAPKYWNKEFQQDIKKLTKQDATKGIIQAGIALGTSNNINRFSDILSVLMMQNGATMMDSNQILFNTVPAAGRETNYNPGLEALRFYLDFSNSGKEVYSWNDSLPNSLEMFTSGKLALMFGYAYDLPTIKAQAPKLNFSVSKLPQIEGSQTEVNFANYWVEAVSKKSKHQNEAWDFIQFATQAEQAKTYLEKTKKPTALRSLINSQREDSEIGIFADQVLTAKSWYHGNDANAAETAIGEMIDNARQNIDGVLSALNTAAAKVQQTIK